MAKSTNNSNNYFDLSKLDSQEEQLYTIDEDDNIVTFVNNNKDQSNKSASSISSNAPIYIIDDYPITSHQSTSSSSSSSSNVQQKQPIHHDIQHIHDTIDITYLDSIKFEILRMFPEADNNYIDQICLKYNNMLDSIVIDMLENGYTKRAKANTSSSSSSSFTSNHNNTNSNNNNNTNTNKANSTTSTIDFSSSSWETSPTYRIAALHTLTNDFPFIRIDDIKKLFITCKYHYFPAVELLEKELGVVKREIFKPITSIQKTKMSEGLNKLGLRIRNTFKYELVSNFYCCYCCVHITILCLYMYILYRHVYV